MATRDGPVILPVREKGLEAVGDRSPRQRPGQVIFVDFLVEAVRKGRVLT